MNTSITSRRATRRRLGLVAGAALALAGAYVGPSTYVAVVMTRAERHRVTTDPHAPGIAVEEIAFPSRDDRLTLRGWLLTPESGDTPCPPLIAMVHGHNGVRDDPSIGMMPIATALVRAGYAVLLFDLRGHGASDGERFSFGWYERRDVCGALDWAATRGYRRFGLYGFSMGGATALLTAAEDSRVAAIVVDSSYADLSPVLAREVPRRSHLPRSFVPGVILMARLLYGADAWRIRPYAAAAALGERPLLVIHGEEDPYVPATDAQRLWAARYGAGGDPDAACLHIFPGAGHVGSYLAAPDAYLATILAFWREALPLEEPSLCRPRGG